MAFTNFETKEIHCKIVYFGPKGSGKTENLKSIWRQTSPEMRSGLVEIAPEDGKGMKFFDFLPLSIGKINQFHLKMHLFTLPETASLEPLSSVFLKGIDGAVFVADSSVLAMDANQTSWDQMQSLLLKEGYSPQDIPKVIQYNKRDIDDPLNLESLNESLNRDQLVEHEAVATMGKGTLETLESMAKLVIQKLESR